MVCCFFISIDEQHHKTEAAIFPMQNYASPGCFFLYLIFVEISRFKDIVKKYATYIKCINVLIQAKRMLNISKKTDMSSVKYFWTSQTTIKV